MLDIGVRIHLYQKGLLHTKSITADRRISMFGTVNLDMRSLWLNYEVALFVYGEAVRRAASCLAAIVLAGLPAAGSPAMVEALPAPDS